MRGVKVVGLSSVLLGSACDKPAAGPQVADVHIDAAATTSAASSTSPPKVQTCVLEAEDACRRACDAGDSESCARWGVVRGRRGETTAELLTLFEVACDKGSGRACNGAGYLLEVGVDGKKDLDRSLRFFERATKLGYAPGHYNIGQRYRDGVGVKADPAEACRAYGTGCDKKDPDACFALAGMFIDRLCPGGEDRVDGLLEKGCTMPTEERVRHREAACSLVRRGR